MTDRDAIREQLSAYLDGALPQEEDAKVRQALKEDAALRAECESMRAVDTAYQSLGRMQAPDELEARILAAVAEDVDAPHRTDGAGNVAPLRLSRATITSLALAAAVLMVFGVVALIAGNPQVSIETASVQSDAEEQELYEQLEALGYGAAEHEAPVPAAPPPAPLPAPPPEPAPPAEMRDGSGGEGGARRAMDEPLTEPEDAWQPRTHTAQPPAPSEETALGYADTDAHAFRLEQRAPRDPESVETSQAPAGAVADQLRASKTAPAASPSPLNMNEAVPDGAMDTAETAPATAPQRVTLAGTQFQKTGGAWVQEGYSGESFTPIVRDDARVQAWLHEHPAYQRLFSGSQPIIAKIDGDWYRITSANN